MSNAKMKLAIINRSFWPIYPVIGEALLRFAEKQAEFADVSVVLQDHAGIRSQLAKHRRGQRVNFYPCKAWSVSGSGISRRIADAIFFMIWVLVVLVWKRPTKIYVSTDPPVLVPFIVMVYCKLFGANYVYHLQDIHPEAANVVVPVNKLVYRLFRWLDSLVMRNAHLLITITAEMAAEVKSRSFTMSPVVVLPNPAVSFDKINVSSVKKTGFTFCGNAGRLQRIPLLIQAIEEYCLRGGRLPFLFAGAGVYANDLKRLSDKHENVSYLGVIAADQAAEINASYQWALLPIEDEVTRYAFPSKSSSYVFSGAFVAAVCGKDTSVAAWVKENNVGLVIPPSVDDLCEFFVQVERDQVDLSKFDLDRTALKSVLSFDFFVERLETLVCRDVGYVR